MNWKIVSIIGALIAWIGGIAVAGLFFPQNVKQFLCDWQYALGPFTALTGVLVALLSIWHTRELAENNNRDAIGRDKSKENRDAAFKLVQLVLKISDLLPSSALRNPNFLSNAIEDKFKSVRELMIEVLAIKDLYLGELDNSVNRLAEDIHSLKVLLLSSTHVYNSTEFLAEYSKAIDSAKNLRIECLKLVGITHSQTDSASPGNPNP